MHFNALIFLLFINFYLNIVDNIGTALYSGAILIKNKTHNTGNLASMLSKIDIYQEICDEIVLGDLSPGQKITEKSLSERFGTSRGPVREALRRLEANALITWVPNAGARVALFTHAQVQSLLHVRLLLECDAARHAATHATADDINAIEQLLEQHAQAIQASLDGGYAKQNYNNDFHAAIIRASKNCYTEEILLEELYVRLQICRNQYAQTSSRGEPALDEHRKILDAIKEKNPDLTELRMRQHLQKSHENILTLMQQHTQ